MPQLPRFLLLDVLGTLVRDPFHQDVPAFFGTTLDQLVRAKDPTAWLDFERGRIAERELYRRFFADRRAIDGPGLKAAMVAGYRLLPGVAGWLAELSARGVELHALSNYSVWYHEIEARTSLSRFLRWSFVSCDTGHRKPERAAFEHALAALGARPGEVGFVDDQEANVAAARALGLDALLFRGSHALRAELAARGWLPPSGPSGP